MEREYFMRQALNEARLARETGDVPVGCVVVCGGRVVACGRNRREAASDATAHAEVEALRAASAALGRWRLTDCALYVTLEPCPMCAGAILNARIGTLVYGARDREAGACGGVFDLFSERVPYRPKVYAGVLEGECAALLRDFFGSLRA
ncbi:MAG: nucleoside deaminase [Clostridiaceae bacterium]|nr:nucleoside deaminase [Clostridiaceae bacterium]MDY3071970.1 nucleoside deaminase [Eubacteriales bacterium]MDY5015489.1 nucleoside deaminase [Eubacteriales bacterium]